MSLREYARKRRFGETPEPGDEAPPPGKRGRRPIFVVQLHHARARHYDFRLEMDGTLKSWAVPKGPSYRLGEKRLAVEVEDHPISYADFEGDIPVGNYGAGHVDIFDRGVWSAHGDPLEGLAAGKLEFTLHGDRLHGGWKLVRTQQVRSGKPQWLLFKRDDEWAGDLDADAIVSGSAAPPTASPIPAAPTRRVRSDRVITLLPLQVLLLSGEARRAPERGSPGPAGKKCLIHPPCLVRLVSPRDKYDVPIATLSDPKGRHACLIQLRGSRF